MNPNALETAKGDYTYAGEHLRRHKTTGNYYAFVKKGGKQFRRSLKTTDKPLAKRRLADLLNDFARLMPAEAADLTFEQVAEQWLDNTKHTVKPSTVIRRQTCLKAVTPFLSGLGSDRSAWANEPASNGSLHTIRWKKPNLSIPVHFFTDF